MLPQDLSLPSFLHPQMLPPDESPMDYLHQPMARQDEDSLFSTYLHPPVMVPTKGQLPHPPMFSEQRMYLGSQSDYYDSTMCRF